jgi:glutamate 5-kinase
LPAGVTSVTGRFARGDVVVIVNAGNAELGRGLIAFDVEDARRIVGRRSAEIEAILGYRGRAELIHRDDMLLRDG